MRLADLAGSSPADDQRPGLFSRNRPDDPIAVRLTVELRDGRTIEVELPKGVRPKIDLITERDPGAPWVDVGATRAYHLADDSVRIVIEANTRDGRAEDGSLFRFTIQEPTAT